MDEISIKRPVELMPAPSQKLRDADVIGSWISQKSERTQKYYLRIVKDFFSYFQNRGIQDVTTIQLVIYLKIHEKKKESTRNKMKFVLSSLFSYATKLGHIQRNPALALDPIKVPDRTYTKVLNRNQIELMIHCEESLRNKLILRTLYFTGMRVEELTSLIVASFRNTELGPMVSVTGKGKKTRTINVPEFLYLQLESFWKENGYDHTDAAFKSREAPYQALDVRQVWNIVKNAAKKSDIKAKPSPHWLRHTLATHSISSGAPVHVVQRTLGHASIATLSKYLDINPPESAGDFIEEL